MNFLHPVFLWGLAGISVPIVLHFLLRKRVRVVRFSSLVLLRLLQRRRSRRMQLAQLLLLLFRIAIVVSVVLLFAQPLFRSGPLSRLNAGPETVIVLVDNSGSSALRCSSDETVYERLRERLVTTVAAIDPRATIVVLALSPTAEVVFRGGGAQFDPALLPPPAPVRPDLAGAEAKLDEIFGATPVGRRRMVLLSDFQAFPWKKGLEAFASKRFAVDIQRIPHSSFCNWAITGVAADTQMAVSGETCRFIVSTAYAAEGVPVTGSRVVAKVRGKTVASAVLVPAPKSTDGTLRVELPIVVRGEGFHVVTFCLDDDSLAEDNRTTDGLLVVPERLVLILNGDPRAAAINDETFFLSKVYADAAEQSFRVRVFSGEELPESGEVTQAAVVHLAAYSVTDGGFADVLHRYVRRGGTLVLWGGDCLDPEKANEHILGPLLSWKLTGIAEEAGHWIANAAADTPFGHLLAPAFVSNIVSRRYFFIDRGEGSGGPDHVALRMGDGTPIMTVEAVQDGHFVFINATADQEWSDLPLHPLYPVLVATFPRLTRGGIRRLAPGERFSVQVALTQRSDVTAEVRTPRGNKVVVRPGFDGERFTFGFGKTWWPGLYTLVRTIGSSQGKEHFYVAPDGAEAELSFLDEAAVERAAAEAGGEVSLTSTAASLKITDLFFLALLLFLVGEGIVLGVIERAIRGEAEAA